MVTKVDLCGSLSCKLGLLNYLRSSLKNKVFGLSLLCHLELFISSLVNIDESGYHLFSSVDNPRPLCHSLVPHIAHALADPLKIFHLKISFYLSITFIPSISLNSSQNLLLKVIMIWGLQIHRSSHTAH